MRLVAATVMAIALAGASGIAVAQDAPPTADAAEGAAARGLPPPEPGPAAREAAASARAVAARPVDTSDAAAGFTTGLGLRRTIEDDPYAPLGLRVGGFVWYPSVGLTTGYTTNATGTADGKAAGFAIVAPELRIVSDWSRHAATLTLRGSYESFTDHVDDRPAAEALATARLDLADRWTADLGAHYRYGREASNDPNAPAGATRNADTHQYGARAALNGALGRNLFTLEGTADRFLYGDATVGGRDVDQADRDNTVYAARLRLGYPLSGMLTPFIEGLALRRDYDERVDDNGLRRSSTGAGARLGVALDRAPVTTGEIALGWRTEHFDDDALATLSAFTVDGSIAWSPVELVTIRGDMATRIEPSTDPLSSGAIVYDGSLGLAYAIRRNVVLDWSFGARNAQYEGIGRQDWTFAAGFSATWRPNRNVELAAGYVHEWLDSTDSARNYAADTVRLDLRIRH